MKFIQFIQVVILLIAPSSVLSACAGTGAVREADPLVVASASEPLQALQGRGEFMFMGRGRLRTAWILFAKGEAVEVARLSLRRVED